MDDECVALPDGRVLIEYGPVTMTLLAERDGIAQTALCQAALPELRQIIEGLAADLPLLRLPPERARLRLLRSPGKAMLAAVLAVQDPTLTPMAAVAGTVADAVADILAAGGATRVIVNNGGDIALRLAPGTGATVGIISELRTGRIERTVRIAAEDHVGGICTSGLGGRSLTRGVADAVTVFARTAAQADALATHLANASYVEAPEVVRQPAERVEPGSDLGMLPVTVSVGKLGERDSRRAVEQVLRRAAALYPAFHAVVAYVQGVCGEYPQDIL